MQRILITITILLALCSSCWGATYYVSQQQNDATHDGTLSHPFATIAQAFAAVSAGDTIVIGPGTYRENPGTGTKFTVSQNNLSLIGDPTCRSIIRDRPGRVRLTGTDTNNIPTDGIVLSCGTKTGTTIKYLYIDGSKNNVGMQGHLTSDTTIYDCYISSSANGTSASTCYRCMSIGQTAFNTCIAYNCIGLGSTAFLATTANNCLGIGVYLFLSINISKLSRCIR